MESRKIRLYLTGFLTIQFTLGGYNSYWISNYIFTPEIRPLGFTFGIISLVLTAGGWILLFTFIYGLVKSILIFTDSKLKNVNLTLGVIVFLLVFMLSDVCRLLNAMVNLLPLLKSQNIETVYEINYFLKNLMSSSTWNTYNNRLEYFFLFTASILPPVVLKIKKEPLDFLDIGMVFLGIAAPLMMVKVLAAYFTAF